jgi:hypothetical protein
MDAPVTRTATLSRLLAPALALVLASCGGSSDETQIAKAPAPPQVPPDPAATAASAVFDPGWIGAFGASVSGTKPQHLILAKSDPWGLIAVYGDDAATDFKARGLLIAAMPSASSPNRYEGYDPDGEAATLDLTIDPSLPSISGTVTHPSEQKTLTGGTVAAVGYRFDRAAELAAAAGHWELATAQGRQIALDIDAAGAITGTSGACSLHDSRLVPTKTGYGVFAITLKFGGAACSEPHAASDGVYGIAVVYSPMAGGSQLVVGALNGWDPVYLAASGKR